MHAPWSNVISNTQPKFQKTNLNRGYKHSVPFHWPTDFEWEVFHDLLTFGWELLKVFHDPINYIQVPQPF